MRGSPLTGADAGPDPGAADLWTLPEHRVPELAARLGGPELLAPDERTRHDRLLRSGARPAGEGGGRGGRGGAGGPPPAGGAPPGVGRRGEGAPAARA
ncbi:hypothetical protein ACFW7O_21715, partial [Streptomyces diastatochromogenes]